MNRAPPNPYPRPDGIIEALGKVSAAWVQYKKAHARDRDQAAGQYAAAYAEAARVTLSVWLSESQQAYVAIGVDGEVYALRPAHWPSVIWPEAVEIWAQVEGLYAIVARYLDDEAKIFLNFELARIQGELLTYVDMDTTLADVAAATARTRSRVESALANLLLGATTRATFRYLRGMVRGLLITAPLTVLIGLVVIQILPWRDLVIGATACAIAGQFGALVSVLTRVSGGGLDIDYRAGDRMLAIVGFARPVLGAILASAVYFATVGGVVPLKGPDEVIARFAFFVAVGFIAGFSERYAQDMLSISPNESQKAATSAVRAHVA